MGGLVRQIYHGAGPASETCVALGSGEHAQHGGV